MQILKRTIVALLLFLTPAWGAADPARIVVFGDSLTRGFGLPAGQGFVPALSRWLAAEGADVRLVNAGLSGDTTFGGRVRIGWALQKGADAVIVELGANDMLLGLSPERTEKNLDAIIRRAAEGGRPVLLLGIHPTAGADGWRRRWQSIWPRLAARHDVQVVADIYAGIRAVPATERGALLQKDRLHASARGVATMVELVGPQVLEMLERLP